MINSNFVQVKSGKRNASLGQQKVHWAMKDVGERKDAYNRPLVGKWMGMGSVSQSQNLHTARGYRGWAPKRASISLPWGSGSKALSFKDKWALKSFRLTEGSQGMMLWLGLSVKPWRTADRGKQSYKHVESRGTWTVRTRPSLGYDSSEINSFDLISPIYVPKASKTIHMTMNPKSILVPDLSTELQTHRAKSLLNISTMVLHTHTQHNQLRTQEGVRMVLSIRENQIWVMTLSFIGHQIPYSSHLFFLKCKISIILRIKLDDAIKCNAV